MSKTSKRKKFLDFKVSKNGCFIANSHRPNKHGYIHFWHNGRDVRAHRLVYEECFGEIPEGLVVRHKCDVRNCINPEHLELGTIKENSMDMVIRGRSTYGERNGKSKIDERTATIIKAKLNSGLTAKSVAMEFNLKPSTVEKIKSGQSWKYLA
ncbi:hypothetical protein PAECIP111893_02418 [Paenibacillus plantiphilus]|uniref:HNH nuclease domain-containing protein n=1 Tax=Paenibacillus plantiphilus TaxID=2905650 RepID=A0ABN8GJ65_9BACL|nr:HNH endonuclease signature motif containing protein [Paenibacillus plantiphilus]CAH1205787.1 hypothetical protein PAECIP111893_02418 [Paenibacillus plantiphilus]